MWKKLLPDILPPAPYGRALFFSITIAVFAGAAMAAAAKCPVFENPVPVYASLEARKFIGSLPDPATYPAAPEAGDLEGWRALRQQEEERSKPAVEAVKKNYDPQISAQTMGGVPVLDIRPRGWHESRRVMVFVHGGGYTMGSAETSLVASVPLAADTGMRIISVDYTTAPFAKYDEMLDQVIAVIEALHKQGYAPHNVGLAGISAGGGLAVGSVLKMRDEKRPTVGAIVLWSPAADLTMRGETITTLGCYELAFSIGRIGKLMDVVVSEDRRKDPYVSPAFGHYARDFPPTLIQGGTREALLSGFVLLYQAIDTAGGIAKLDLYEGMVHAFQEVKYDLPESGLARRKSGDFLNKYIR